MDTSDEFDKYNFQEFTADDLAFVDESLLANTDTGGPSITIEVEQSTNPQIVKGPPTRASSSKATGRRDQASPFQRYRSWRKVMSVSDLVSPAWCEVQFDYGLRQKRSRRLEERPASFTSAEGKKISVEKKVAAKNDRTVKRGKSVHKILEQEVRPVEVRVDIVTEEERWALRLVNMLSGVQSLMTLRYTREMPVFGVVHEHVVVGIIDELSRKPVPVSVPDPRVEPSNGIKRSSESSHATPKSKRIRRTHSLSESKIWSLVPASPEEGEVLNLSDSRPSAPPSPTPELISILPQAPRPSHNFTLHILDTKSRRTDSLPDHVDTVSSRHQLRLYHRLLSSLISSDPRNHLDFGALWIRLGVNPTKIFSTRFMSQARVILGGDANNIEFNCLDDLTGLWRDQIRDLDVGGIDETLQLVYRIQPNGPHPRKKKGKGKKSRGKGKGKAKAIDVLTNQEELDLARAIEESLKSVNVGQIESGEHEFSIVVAESLKQSQPDTAGPSDEGTRDLGILTGGCLPSGSDFSEELTNNPDLLWVLQESLLDQAKQVYGQETTDEEASGPTTPVQEVPSTPPRIIGTKEFPLDENLLEEYLTDVLQWWHGQRPPKGVEVALSRRCFSCEYMEDCEWREKKANEATLKVKRMKAAGQPPKLDVSRQHLL